MVRVRPKKSKQKMAQTSTQIDVTTNDEGRKTDRFIKESRMQWQREGCKDSGWLVVMDPITSLSVASSHKLAPVKESFTQSCLKASLGPGVIA
jgi:hypothetical protein